MDRLSDRPSGVRGSSNSEAAIAQLGERQTEDLEVPGSIPGFGNFSSTRCASEPLRGKGVGLFL